jgi:hypothetical protein
VRGVQKHGLKKNAKSPCQKLFPRKLSENRQKLRCQFFLDFFFVLSRFQVLLSDGSSKTQQKTFYKKNRVEKFLQKNRQKNAKPMFSRLFFYHVFGRFSVRGVSVHLRLAAHGCSVVWQGRSLFIFEL